MTNEMIERCARAIAGYSEGRWQQMPDNRLSPIFGGASKAHWLVTKEMYRVQARRVLQTLMTPTDEMVEAGSHSPVWDDADSRLSSEIASECWTAMLTKALEENP